MFVFFSSKFPNPNLTKNSIQNSNPPEGRTTNVDLLHQRNQHSLGKM